MITVIFETFTGDKSWVCKGEEGMSLLDLAQENDIDIEGACEGNMACSTCHIITKEADYDTLPAPSLEEEEMLDLAYGLTSTSRLGCQIRLNKTMDGMVFKLPSGSRNMMGF